MCCCRRAAFFSPSSSARSGDYAADAEEEGKMPQHIDEIAALFPPSVSSDSER